MLKCSNTIIWIGLVFLHLPLFAQQGVQWTHDLSNLPEDFDLHIATVDQQDRIWLGNDKGLWIFDGIDCRKIREYKISSAVSALYVHTLDSVAIGTKEGKAYLVSPEGLDTLHCDLNSSVSDIFIPSHGTFWLSSHYDGLRYIKNGKYQKITEDDGLASNNISDLESDEKGGVWLATDNGLSHVGFTREESGLSISNYSSEQGLTDPLLTSISYDADLKTLYLSTHSAGVFSFQDHRFSQLIPPNKARFIHSIQKINEHRLLIEADSPTLCIYDLKKKNTTNLLVEESLLLPPLYTTEGFIWYFTNKRRLEQESIYFTKFITPFTPQAIIVRKDQVWIGTEKGLFQGPISSDSFKMEPIEIFRDQNIISLEYMEEKLLIGTFGNGLYLFDPATGNYEHFTMEDGLSDESILDIYYDGEHVWLGTLGGLVMTRWDNNFISEVKNYVDTVYVYHIEEVNDQIYFSTHGDGAGHINGDVQWFSDPLLSTGEISTFDLLDDNNALYVTAKNGLIFQQSGSVVKIQTPTNVSFETTSSIVADSISHRFFISHANGLDIFDPADTSIIHLGNNLRLNFSTSALNAHSYHTKLKKHFFGSASGFYCVEPDLYYSGTHPKLSVLNVKVNNKSHAGKYLNRLASNERTIQLDLLPIWYTDPRAINIRYRITGVHDSWIQTTDPKLIFTDLPYGKHTLQIESGAYGNFYPSSGISLPLTIAYPLWMRWWFILVTISLILIGIYAFIKNRESKLQKWARLEQEKANAQIQALKSQVSPHFMFNSFNTLIALIEEAPNKAVSYAENLSDFFRNLVSKRDLELSTLREEIEMVEAYIKLLSRRFDDRLKARIEIDDWEGYIVTYTLQILTENVVKHNIISRSQPLEFSIKRENDFIVIENKKQPKFTQEDSTGFGLESIRDRYKLLYQKDISVHQTDESFIVKVPIIQNKNL